MPNGEAIDFGNGASVSLLETMMSVRSGQGSHREHNSKSKRNKLHDDRIENILKKVEESDEIILLSVG
jgi:phosphoribosyl-ATP pyrophosphohydrolase